MTFEFGRCSGKLSLRAVDRDRNFENCILNEQNLQENGEEESFEDLQELFEELFKGDIDTFGSSFQTSTCSGSSSSYSSYCESSSSNNKRNSSEMNFGKTNLEDASGFDTNFQNFCLGVSRISSFFVGDMVSTYHRLCTDAFVHNLCYRRQAKRRQDIRKEKGVQGVAEGTGGSRRRGRRQKVSSGHDVSTIDYSGISA